MADREDSNGFAPGIIIGLLAGLAIALLLAPRAGRDLRNFLRSKADDIALMAREVTVNHEKVYKDIWEEHGGPNQPH